MLKRLMVLLRRQRKPRDEKDYAVEFGRYLATSAEGYLDLISRPVENADEISDAYNGLRSAIYEFRKRAAKVASS